MNRAAILARETLAEAAQYLPGSPDHEYRLRAAWKQAQIAAIIAANSAPAPITTLRALSMPHTDQARNYWPAWTG